MDCKQRNIKYRHIVTYKENELWIYNEVEQHSGKGLWIKDIIKDYISGKLVYVGKDNSSQSNDRKLVEADVTDITKVFGEL